jgi:hypothetical protein
MSSTLVILSLILTYAAVAQEPPQTAPAVPVPAVQTMLENSGKPMLVPFSCSQEDIRWGGLSCSEEEPCPIFLELTAANQSGNRILAGGNIHSESVTLYSVRAHPRVRSGPYSVLRLRDWLDCRPGTFPDSPKSLSSGHGRWRKDLAAA